MFWKQSYVVVICGRKQRGHVSLPFKMQTNLLLCLLSSFYSLYKLFKSCSPSSQVFQLLSFSLFSITHKGFFFLVPKISTLNNKKKSQNRNPNYHGRIQEKVQQRSCLHKQMCFLGEGTTGSSLYSPPLRHHALLLVHPWWWIERESHLSSPSN